MSLSSYWDDFINYLTGGDDGSDDGPSTDLPTGGSSAPTGSDPCANGGTTDGAGNPCAGGEGPQTSSTGGSNSVWQNIAGATGQTVAAIAKAFENPDGSPNWAAIAKAGLTGAALIGAQQSNAAESKYLNDKLAMQQGILTSANADYASRAPLRDTAFAKLQQLSANGPSGDIYRPFLRAEGVGGQSALAAPVFTPQTSPGTLPGGAPITPTQPKSPTADPCANLHGTQAVAQGCPPNAG